MSGQAMSTDVFTTIQGWKFTLLVSAVCLQQVAMCDAFVVGLCMAPSGVCALLLLY